MSTDVQRTRKLAFAQAAIALAERSNHYTQLARLQTMTNMDIAGRYVRRAYLQQKAALRLIRLASVT